MPETILPILDRVPPFLVYYGSHLLTGKHVTVNEMAKRSGLCARTILRIAYRSSWRDVRVGAVERFCGACGVDPMNPEPLIEAVRAEVVKEKPFPQLHPPMRKVMLANFSMLSGRHTMSKAAMRDAA